MCLCTQGPAALNSFQRRTFAKSWPCSWNASKKRAASSAPHATAGAPSPARIIALRWPLVCALSRGQRPESAAQTTASRVQVGRVSGRAGSARSRRTEQGGTGSTRRAGGSSSWSGAGAGVDPPAGCSAASSSPRAWPAGQLEALPQPRVPCGARSSCRPHPVRQPPIALSTQAGQAGEQRAIACEQGLPSPHPSGARTRGSLSTHLIGLGLHVSRGAGRGPPKRWLCQMSGWREWLGAGGGRAHVAPTPQTAQLGNGLCVACRSSSWVCTFEGPCYGSTSQHGGVQHGVVSTGGAMDCCQQSGL